MFGARPYVSNRYRNEEVDLQPGGSTIVVTTPSDNPFEDPRDIEVDTQQSGGMEGGPDPAMKSRKIHTKVNQHKSIARGKVHAIRTIGPAHTAPRHGGFMPGMGDDSTDFAALTTAQDANFLPAVEASPGAFVVTPASPAAPAASGPSFMSAFTQGLTTAAKVATPLVAAQTAKTNAQAAAAAAAIPKPAGIAGSVTKYLPYIAGGLGVILVLKLLLGGSSARPLVLAATNPRRR